MGRGSTRQQKAKTDLSVGWGFWLIAFAVLYGPAWWWAWRNTYETERAGVFPWVGAFVIATIGAGVVSWAVNMVLRKLSHRANKHARKK